MCEIAEKLSAKFSHARIDLFDQNGVITFGEITFFSGSGYTCFDPDDFILIFSLASSSKFRRTQCPNSRLTTFTSCDVKDITLRTKGVGIE